MAGFGKQVSGAIQYIKGKLQRKAGDLTGNNKMKAKGYMNQGKGGVKYEAGKAEGAIDDMTK